MSLLSGYHSSGSPAKNNVHVDDKIHVMFRQVNVDVKSLCIFTLLLYCVD